jgi:ketosteroid isomerase-like protein
MQPRELVVEFNNSINARDADRLGRLMSDDHELIDTADAVERGKAHCLDLWRGFFEQFPDYRNTFLELTEQDDLVLVVGYSTCSVDVLDGPAIWTARVRANTVSQWRVYEDTPETRQSLGLTQEPARG